MMCGWFHGNLFKATSLDKMNGKGTLEKKRFSEYNFNLMSQINDPSLKEAEEQQEKQQKIAEGHYAGYLEFEGINWEV